MSIIRSYLQAAPEALDVDRRGILRSTRASNKLRYLRRSRPSAPRRRFPDAVPGVGGCSLPPCSVRDGLPRRQGGQRLPAGASSLILVGGSLGDPVRPASCVHGRRRRVCGGLGALRSDPRPDPPAVLALEQRPGASACLAEGDRDVVGGSVSKQVSTKAATRPAWSTASGFEPSTMLAPSNPVPP